VSQATAWCGAGALFLGISRLHQWLTPLGKIQAPALLSVLALLMLFSAPQRWRPADIPRHWLTMGIVALMGFAVVGVPFAIYPGRSFRFLNEAYSRTILLWMTGWAISRSADGARFLARMIAAGGTVAAGLAVLIGKTDSAGRLSGAYTYDPNDVALVSVMTLPMVFWWAMEKRNGIARWLALPAVPVLIYVIVKSGSRSGFLGMAAMFVGLLLVARKRAMPRGVKKASKWVLIGVVVAIPLVPADYVSRIATISSEDDYNRSAESGRIEVWKRGMGYAFGSPLLGVGIGNFGTAEGWSEAAQQAQAMGRGWKWSTAHNSFVLVLAEMGLVAGLLFPYLLIRGVVALLRWNARRPPGEEEDPLPTFLALALIAFMVDGFFLSFAYYDILYAFLAVAAGILHPMRSKRRRARVLAPSRAAARTAQGNGRR